MSPILPYSKRGNPGNTHCLRPKNNIRSIQFKRRYQKVEERHDKKLGPETARGDREHKKDMKKHGEILKEKIDERMNDATTLCLDEFNEREGRTLNIMLYNAPESEKDDPEEREDDDLEFLRILMSEIKLTVPFSQVIRIGVAEKTHSKPRPMRARTTCITDQRNILKAVSILKDTEDYKDMYIKRDETPLERA